eukprot:2015751-Amphidinium_carterae.1
MDVEAVPAPTLTSSAPLGSQWYAQPRLWHMTLKTFMKSTMQDSAAHTDDGSYRLFLHYYNSY